MVSTSTTTSNWVSSKGPGPTSLVDGAREHHKMHSVWCQWNLKNKLNLFVYRYNLPFKAKEFWLRLVNTVIEKMEKKWFN